MASAKWIGSLAAAYLVVGAGGAVAQAPSPVEPPPLSAELERCQTSPLPAQRVAEFLGSMPAIDGASRMQMRFELQRRRPYERSWRRLRGVEGFGVWETALPDRAGFVFHKRVDGLQVPAAYRARVGFRWSRSDGTIVRRARRLTLSCSQPDLRPDLAPRALGAVLDVRPALAIYTLVVRNEGRSSAGPFAVRVAGGVTEVGELAAGKQLEVPVVAAACMPGSIVVATVDWDRRVAEADERNGLRRRCPLAPDR